MDFQKKVTFMLYVYIGKKIYKRLYSTIREIQYVHVFEQVHKSSLSELIRPLTGFVFSPAGCLHHPPHKTGQEQVGEPV